MYEYDGGVVPGLVNRNVNRCNEEGTRTWGGPRVKSYTIDDGICIEPEAFEVQEERKLFTKTKY